MASIFLNALIRIDADLTRKAEQLKSVGPQPRVEQIASEPRPEPDLEDFGEPGLSNNKTKKPDNDPYEYEQLMNKSIDFIVLKGIV